MLQKAGFKIKGMNRDLAVSVFNPDFSYENKNIRLTSLEDNTTLCCINEQGTLDTKITFDGTIIGYATFDKEIVLFGAAETDYIGVLKIENPLSFKKIAIGNFNFKVANPIETVTYHENDELKKVYWVDGINPPRFINITKDYKVVKDNTIFNFVASMLLEENVTISKNSAGGMFSPGTIQYVFTYLNQYGQETNIFYQSPLYYITFSNNGTSPDGKVSTSFEIKLKELDTKFDFVRIYSIKRTTQNATPECKLVVELKNNSEGIYYVDTGLNGDAIDPTELLYVGGEEVIAGTISHKDNTLFLGDLEPTRKPLEDVKKKVYEFYKDGEGKNSYIEFIANKVLEKDVNTKGTYLHNFQLNKNSQQIKSFKYLDYYRFGFQVQDDKGKWSEPIWLEDKRNEIHIKENLYYNTTEIVAAYLDFNSNPTKLVRWNEIINDLKALGFKKIRPTIVYPSINDREVICQGVVCPTVYNVRDRLDNTPFVQSSWFVRPNAAFDVDTEDWSILDSTLDTNSMFSKKGALSLAEMSSTGLDLTKYGSWAEFRHNYPLPESIFRNSEIQLMEERAYVEVPLIVNSTEADRIAAVSKYKEKYGSYFFVDQSIFTFHSPDIEFDDNVKNIDFSDAKFRIVGKVPITSTMGDIEILTENSPNIKHNSAELGYGKYVESVTSENNFEKYSTESIFGWKGILSGIYWIDYLKDPEHGSSKNNMAGFMIYPWHRNGSLNNTRNAPEGGSKTALLKSKVVSNLRYSLKTHYFGTKDIWYAEDSENNTGISDAKLFDSNDVIVTKLKAPKYSGLSDIYYYGNYEKLLTPYVQPEKELYETQAGYKTQTGYPIYISEYLYGEDRIYDANGFDFTSITSVPDIHDMYKRFNIVKIEKLNVLFFDSGSSDFTRLEKLAKDQRSTDPIMMKYKSTPHVVMALNYTKEGNQRVLPTHFDFDKNSKEWKVVNKLNTTLDYRFFWNLKKDKRNKLVQDVIQVKPKVINNKFSEDIFGYLWLGELYRDNVANRFGGTTEEALEDNLWIAGGEAVDLEEGCVLEWTEGDTYYQRYDHIKTYPFSEGDTNSIVDIVSFRVETRINIDGRYDNNRGLPDNKYITPENFNILNLAYTQDNNFFNYRSLNSNKLNLDKFRNTITWTKTKIPGDMVDTWTNITMASLLDLDGDKGPVRAIRRFNNNLIAFQDKGVSQILYNEQMQMSTVEGVPIEIANSGKVAGKRYITDKKGCRNKWSICETPMGIYFVDDINKDISYFNGQNIADISLSKGFNSYIKSKELSAIWDLKDFNNIVTYYDKVFKDVYFIDKENALAYNEALQEFTSFYSYENTPYMINSDVGTLLIKDSKLWIKNKGAYNKFYTKYQPFYITYIINQDPLNDKIFDNIEFRSDTFDGDLYLADNTFDTLNTWNEYQEGIVSLEKIKGIPSSLKKKFRIWHANIPRWNVDKNGHTANNRDRMRNPWLYLKLSKETDNNFKTILYDTVVQYFRV
jgi:hypothetical protein